MSGTGYHLPPSFRLLVCFIIGIVCGDARPESIAFATGGAAVGFVAMLAGCRRGARNGLFGPAACVTTGCLGFVLMVLQLEEAAYGFTGERSFYRVGIVKPPEEKARSVLCHTVLKQEWRQDAARPVEGGKQFLVYLAKDSASLAVRRGDELLIHTCLAAPERGNIPGTFDYARFLARRGVSGTAYVPAGHWMPTGHKDPPSFLQKALDMRKEVVGLYRRLGFRGDELAVLSALTVGDQDELSDEITETYSVSGASHVLALSGMHIALIYALLAWMLAPLWRWRIRLKPYLQLVIIFFLWGFAFITGLSPSVVRAVAMCTLYILVGLRVEQAWSADTMIAAAFAMLVYNPAWLFDVGFQLSFLAVAAILEIHPKIFDLWKCRHPAVRKVWGMMSVSIAAQIGTAPLVAHYFERFSTHFLLTNLWAVPVSTLAVYAAVLLLAMTPFPTLQQLFAPVVERLIRAQNDGLRWIEQLPYASIDGIWLDVAGVCLLYAFILQANHAWKVRTLRSLYCTLSVLLCFTGYRSGSFISHTPQPGIAFYSVRGCPAIHCLAGGSRSWLVCPDSLPDAAPLRRSLSSHWNHLQLSPPPVINGKYAGPALLVEDQIVVYKGKQLCMVSDNRWRGKQASCRLDVDYLFIAKGYRGGLSELAPLFNVRQVVLDASISAYYRQRIQEDCNRLDIPCRLLEQESMYVVPL